MSQKSIDTAAIASAAAEISTINNQLTETLSRSAKTVQSLRSVWSGQASEAAIAAFNAFESKYSIMYRQMLDDYSKFLKNYSAEGYADTETKGIRLADTI